MNFVFFCGEKRLKCDFIFVIFWVVLWDVFEDRGKIILIYFFDPIIINKSILIKYYFITCLFILNNFDVVNYVLIILLFSYRRVTNHKCARISTSHSWPKSGRHTSASMRSGFSYSRFIFFYSIKGMARLVAYSQRKRAIYHS